MQGKGFGGQAVGFGEGLASGDTAGKIGKADAEMGCAVFVEIGNVIHGFPFCTIPRCGLFVFAPELWDSASAQEPGWVS